MNALMYGQTASGSLVPLLLGSDGALTNEPATTPWKYAAFTGGITDTNAVTLAAAAGAGLVNYMTGLQILNKSATPTEVTINDVATSTVIARYYAAASMTVPIAVVFPTPLASTPNSALSAACVTTSTATFVNAQGFVEASADTLVALESNVGYLLDDNGGLILDDNNVVIILN